MLPTTHNNRHVETMVFMLNLNPMLKIKSREALGLMDKNVSIYCAGLFELMCRYCSLHCFIF